MNKTILGIFSDTASAERTIGDLRSAGIVDNDISYLYSSEGRVSSEGSTADAVGDNTASGMGAGAILGGIAGFIVANGILPGLGTLFVAGPLAAALGFTGVAATTAAGAITGAAAGGVIGALTGFGVSEDEAKIYEERIKLGSVLVATQTDNPEAVREIFVKHGADEIREY